MNRREKTKLKSEQRDAATRKARIAEIQAGNVQAPAEYNDPLAARKEACKKAASELPFKSLTLKDYQDAQEEKKKDN